MQLGTGAEATREGRERESAASQPRSPSGGNGTRVIHRTRSACPHAMREPPRAAGAAAPPLPSFRTPSPARGSRAVPPRVSAPPSRPDTPPTASGARCGSPRPPPVRRLCSRGSRYPAPCFRRQCHGASQLTPPKPLAPSRPLPELPTSVCQGTLGSPSLVVVSRSTHDFCLFPDDPSMTLPPTIRRT